MEWNDETGIFKLLVTLSRFEVRILDARALESASIEIRCTGWVTCQNTADLKSEISPRDQSELRRLISQGGCQ